MEIMKNITLAILTLVIASGCVTQKKRGEVPPVKKFYHDITAEFNGYFNATEILKETYVSMSEQEPENYNKLLPVYPYVEVENPQAAAPQLDEAIKKVTIVNALHEPSHWVDDCYLLAGKAQYLKQDYEAAEETFEYLVSEFSPEAKLNKAKQSKAKKPRSKAESQKIRKERTKTRKKEKQEKEKSIKEKRKAYKKEKKQRERERKRERKARQKARKKGKRVPKKTTTPEVEEVPALETPNATKPATEKEPEKKTEEQEEPPLDTDEPNGPFAHKPAFQEGQLWLARTYIERDKFVQADYLLRQLNNNRKIYPEVASELAAVTAHFFIKQKEYEQAIAPLERAIDMSKDRNAQARYTYILAQLYEMQNNSSEAFKNYEQVVKLKPKYEMEFSATMSMIINEYDAKGTTSSEAISRLEKLLKDEKNVDYWDRIYFSIAEIYLRQGEETKGVENLELALEAGGSSEAQQAETYLTLAAIYYKKEDYLKANDYYGRALTGLSKSDSRYSEVERLSKVLKDIADRVATIEKQDSLLRIADMTPDEKKAFAFERKKEQDEERRKAAIAAATQQTDSKINRPTRRPAVAGSAPARLASSQSNYWAYNDRAVKRGQRDFQSKWGGRSLDDNWRRSNKTDGGSIQSDTTENIVATQALTDAQVANMLRGVPQSKAQMEQANELIMDAMFELGVLYKEKLEKPKKAVETLEELLHRYPDNKYTAEAMYHLYLLYKDLGNSSKAQEYYNKLTSQYSDTVFAKVLTDPDFINNLNKEEKALARYYDQTYEQFSKGDYQSAYDRLQQATENFGTEHPLQAKFALLNAMTLGSIEGQEAYINALKKVVAEYPQTDEQKRAREILRLLGEGNSGALGQQQEANAAKNEFQYEPDKMHYIVIALSPEVSLTDAKIAVSNFNRKYYQLENLRISNIYLMPEGKERFPIIVVRRFKNAKEAVAYYKASILNGSDFIQEDFEIYPVTQNNYRQIIRNKSLGNYQSFFETNYD